jgi:hypothetical protein
LVLLRLPADIESAHVRFVIIKFQALKGGDMKTKLQLLFTLLLVMFLSVGQSASAQSTTASQRPTSSVKTNSRILYNGGYVLVGAANLYVIWYGCWDETCRAGNTLTQSITRDFMFNFGASPYAQINAMYPNFAGQTPSGSVLYGGEVFDQNSHGLELTATDIQTIVRDQIEGNHLPPDPAGIYLVLASAEVSSTATGFCVPGALPHHGKGFANGSQFKYAFAGNAARCPNVAAPQFLDSNGTQLPTPNGNLAGDAMVTTIGHLINVAITNSFGDGWFDRYGLQNADKCVGEFGPTYLVNGGRANIKLGQRDYLLQQNWINDKKGHCALNSSL